MVHWCDTKIWRIGTNKRRNLSKKWYELKCKGRFYDSFKIRFSHMENLDNINDDFSYEFKVLGNIYETPYLLEESE